VQKRILFLAALASALLVVAAPSMGAGKKGGKGGGNPTLPVYLVANLPAGTITGLMVLVTDGLTDADCSVGGGTTAVVCFWDGSAWVPTGDSGAGAGDSITVDSTEAEDPTFSDTPQIGVSMSSNEVTWNITANSLTAEHIDVDAINTAELSDGSDDPLVGQVVHVDSSSTADFEYYTKQAHIDFVGAADLGANTFTATQQGTTWSVTDAGVAKLTSIDDIAGTPLWGIATDGVITAVTYGAVDEANLMDNTGGAPTGVWDFDGADSLEIPSGPFASLPGAPAVGMVYQITNSSAASACDGDGATDVLCIYNGAAWVSVSSAGSGDLLADGSVPLSAGWDVGNFTITANGLTIDGALTGVASLAGATEATIETQVFDADAQTVSGVLTFTAEPIIDDDKKINFGAGSDWGIEYDESVDNQLLIHTTNIAAAATDDPMLQILVGSVIADQEVFGVAKGTQSSNTDLLVVDEDGDVFVGNDLDIGASSIILEAAANSITMASRARDTCDTEGEFWFDSTAGQDRWEFCQSSSGAPTLLGGGSGAFSDASDPIVQNDTALDLHIGDGAGTLTGKVEIGGDTDQPQLVVEGHSTQTSVLMALQKDDDTVVVSVSNAGNILAQGIEDTDGPGTLWEIQTDGTAKFASVTTGASQTPSVVFNDDDSSDEDSDASIVAASTDTGDGSEDTDLAINVQVASTLTQRFFIDADGKTKIEGAPLQVDDPIFIKEQAEADADVEAYGQIWVDTATPNVLYFTDDAGTDFQLGAAGAGDVSDVGDCNTGAAFTGACGTQLDSNTDIIMLIDADTGGTESFQIEDGDNGMIFEISSDGPVDAKSLNFITTGTITGNVNVVLDATTSDSPSGSDLRGSMLVYSNAGVVTITLPDVDTVGLGASACFYDSDTTAIIKIEIDNGDKILLDDTLLDAGDTIDSPGDLGDFICLMAIDVDTTWATLGKRGTWIDGGAT
jgi:hypothetical protein